MRLTFIFAAVIAASLHASGAALPSATASNIAEVENEASPAIADSTHADGGRMLRRVEKNEIDEERIDWSKVWAKLTSKKFTKGQNMSPTEQHKWLIKQAKKLGMDTDGL
uniref:RxLR effector protein n=1 Tax=Phytophthora sojae TaxID=67593 RepID=G1FQR9_PHYSO|nr:Avh7a [Phytophthora sojae]AEK80458.1 Avh7a [Phytophthora sojae]